MNRISIWVVFARLVQIVLGVTTMALSIAMTQKRYWSSYYYYGGENRYLQIAAAFTSGGVALFGFFGLCGATARPDSIRSGQLFLLILFIDCWAIALSVAAGTCLSVLQGDHVRHSKGILITAIACAFLCLLAIIPLMIRTIRLWWNRVLWRSDDKRQAPSDCSTPPGTSRAAELQTPPYHPPVQSRGYYPTDEETKGDDLPSPRFGQH